MPEPQYVTKDGLDRVDNRLTEQIRENARHIKQNSESIVKLETLYGTLVKLPDTIASLEKTVLNVGHNMEVMATRMNQINESVQEQKDAIKSLKEENEKQNENINRVDSKSKIDWANFVSGNFWNILWKVIVVISALLVAYKAVTGL